jgi:hypothetical protein
MTLLQQRRESIITFGSASDPIWFFFDQGQILPPVLVCRVLSRLLLRLHLVIALLYLVHAN